MKTYTTIELKAVLELHLKWLRNEEGGEHADLQHANLQHANLQDANLQDADLRDADLQHADLQDADLRYANLQDADLQGANLRGANLQHANLQHADLQHANLRGADLQHANLRGADLDFSCLPLWCGGSRFKASAKLILQLLAHVSTITVDDADDELKAALETVKKVARKSHRASDLGIGGEE